MDFFKVFRLQAVLRPYWDYSLCFLIFSSFAQNLIDFWSEEKKKNVWNSIEIGTNKWDSLFRSQTLYYILKPLNTNLILSIIKIVKHMLRKTLKIKKQYERLTILDCHKQIEYYNKDY